MALNDSQKIDYVFKKVKNLGRTSSSKNYYEEGEPGGVLISNDRLLMDSVPSAPPSSTTSIVKCYIPSPGDGRLLLTVDPTVVGSQAWKAIVGLNVLKNWIPPSFGIGYAARIFKSDNVTEIPTTDSSNWIFDYESGVLTFDGTCPDTGGIYLHAYEYVGIIGAAGADLSLHLDQTTPQTVENGKPIFEDGINIGDDLTIIEKDVSDNLSFTDSITGTRTLAELATGGGTDDHAALINLTWSTAGHTIDTDLEVGVQSISQTSISTPVAPAAGKILLYAYYDGTNTKFYAISGDDSTVYNLCISDNVVDLTTNQTIYGVKTFDSFPLLPFTTPTLDNQPVTWGVMQSFLAGLTWQLPVEDMDLSAPPVSVTGDRYIVKATGTGLWAGHDNEIATSVADGVSWTFEAPIEGWAVIALDASQGYTWNGSNWVYFAPIITYTAGAGLSLAGYQFSIADLGVTNAMLAGLIENSKLLTVMPAKGGIGLTTLGLANQILGVNAAVTGYEPKTLVAGTNITISHGPNSIGISAVGGGGTGTDYFMTTEPLHTHPASSYTLAIPVALTAASSYLRKKVDLTGSVQFRLVVNQAVAGLAGSKFRLRYSLNNSTWFDLDSDNSGDLDVGTGTGVKIGTWTNIVAGAKQDAYIQLYSLLGNGTTAPQWRQISVQFRYNSTIADLSTTSYVYNEATIHSHPASSVTWVIPLLPTEFYSATARQKINLSGVEQYRIMVYQYTAGYAGADLNLQYSVNGTTWFAADSGGAGEIDVGVGTGIKVGAWTDLLTSAKQDVWIRLVGKDGNGSTSAAWRQVKVQFRTAIGGANAAGEDKQVQFNDGGVLAGSSEFTYDKVLRILAVAPGVKIQLGPGYYWEMYSA